MMQPAKSHVRNPLRPLLAQLGRILRMSQLSAVLSVIMLLIFTSVSAAVYTYTRTPAPVYAATSSTLNFQARLMTSAGNTVPDGYYNIQFNLYDVSAGGSTLWTETRDFAGTDDRVRIVNGFLSVNLGSVTSLPSTINWDQEHWLGMTIRGAATCDFATTCTPADSEMTPRLKLTAVPYAFRAGQADNVRSSNTNAASTNSAAITIQSGNAAGATSNSGNITLDVGTATGTAGTLSVGTANTSGITLGRVGITSILQGSLRFSSLNCTSNTNGGALTADASGNISCTDDDSGGGGSGVTTVGAVDSQAKSANGAVISGVNIYLQTADATYPGLVSTGAQDFAGAKTFLSPLTVGNTSTLGTLSLHDGNGQKTVLQPGNSASDLTFILPTTVGASNECLKNSGTAGTLTFANCNNGSGAGGTITLQDAYDAGNTIATTDARNLLFTLADTATDANFVVNVASGSAGVFKIQNNGADTLTISGAGAVSGATTITGSGTFNTTGGAIQTNSTDRITNAGGLTNITGYSQASGNFLQSGTGTFGTGTGVVSLNGATDIAATVSLATKAGTTYTTAGSANNVAISTASLYRLDTSGAAQTITGIVAGRDGQILTLVNADAALSVTLSNLSGSSSAANQISTGTSADVAIAPGGSTTLIYDASSSLWRIIGGVAGGAGVCGTCANTALSNLSGVNINTALNRTSGDLALTTTTSGNITLTTTAVAAGLVNVLTGNLKVGNAAPTVALNGEDAFIEGTLEVDSTSRFENTLTVTSGGIDVTGASAIDGGQIDLNVSSNFATNINTGTSTGAIAIGNSVAGAVTIQNGTAGIAVTTAATTNNALTVTGNSLTTGTGLSVGSTSALMTSGNIASFNQTGSYTTPLAISGNVVNVNRSVAATVSAGAITLDSTNGNVDSNGTELTWSHTVGSFSNRVLIVAVHMGGGDTVSSVTYGGVALSRIADAATDDASIWILVNPAVGTANVVVDNTAGADPIAGRSSSWYNVHQTTPTGTAATATGSSTTPSVVVTSAAGEVVVDSLMSDNVSNPTVGAGQTILGATSFTGFKRFGNSYEAGAASTTMSWTSSNGGWAIAAIPLKPSAASYTEITGAAQSISSSCTGTSCIDTSNVLSVSQLFGGATGAAVSIQNAGSGADIQLGNGLIQTANKTATSTNSTNVTIKTGNATGTTSNSGNISIDVGTATQTAGTISIGAANTSAITIGRSTVTTTINGNFSHSGTGTFGTGTGVVSLNGNTNVAATASLATMRGADYTTAGSANNVVLNVASLYRLDTSGAAQTITGIAAGRDGQALTLVNADAALAVTLSNLSGSSLAANQITTGTGSDLSLAAGASVDLIYDAGASLWRVVGGVAGGAGTCPTCANTALSNIASTNISAALNRTSGNLALQTTTSGDITLTTAAAAGLVNILTGNLKVGDAVPTVSLNGEDAYIEGTLEVDGTSRFDAQLVVTSGGIDITGVSAIDGGQIDLNASSNFATNINTGTSTGLVTIGGGSGTFSLQTTNIDISSAGAVSGITGYSQATGGFTYGTASDFSINLSGTNDFWIQDAGSTVFTVTDNGSLDLDPVDATATIQLGSTSQTGGITLGRSTASNTINIGNANTLTGNTQTINIGAGTPAGTGKSVVTIGNSVAASSVTLQAGSGGINLNGSTVDSNAATLALFGTPTTINIGAAVGAGGINLAGGSGSTGCTVDGATGDLTCSGTISGGASVTLQSAYTADADGSDAIISLTTTDGGVLIRDNATPIASTLFAVQSSAAANYLSVSASTINLGVSTVLASNQSLTISGGATASRPGSPTDGMVYYDTTTKQLLVWNATKNTTGGWQADSAPYVLVAASDSSDAAKASADYVADGNTGAAADGDQVQINDALTAAAAAGGKGKVYLFAGTYVADATILIPNNTTLAGAGRDTLIELADLDATDNLIQNSDTATGTGVTIQDLRLDGRDDLNTAGVQYGIYLNGIGDGVGDTARQGAKITGLFVEDFRTGAVALANSDNSTVSDSTLQGSGYGIYLAGSSTNNTITNNTIQGSGYGLLASSSSGNTITGNTVQGNVNAGLSFSSSSGNTISGNIVQGHAGGSGIELLTGTNNTITGNTTQGNIYGIYLSISSNGNTITGNTTQGNSDAGIFLSSSTNNTITGNNASGNTLYGIRLVSSASNIVSINVFNDNGGATNNNAVYLSASDFNSIAGNSITDTACTTTCYAINILNSTSDKNYLEVNRYSGSTANAASINDAGTGTIYAGQSTNSTTSTNSDVTDFLFRGSNSASAFRIQNSSAQALLTVDSINTRVTLDDGQAAQANLFVVDSSSAAPTGINGGIYYDTSLGKFRCYQAGAFTDCIGSGGTLQSVYDAGNTITTTSARNISVTLADTATDSNFLVNVASGSTSKFAVQKNGTDTFAVDANGFLTVQSAAALTNGQTAVTQTANVTSTSGGTMRGYQLNQTITSTTSAGTNIGHEINQTDNATALANTNTGLKVTLAGSNNADSQYGIDVSVNSGFALRATTSGDSNSLTCGPFSGGISVAVCADNTSNSTSGAGLVARHAGGGTTITATSGSAVYGVANNAGVVSQFYKGVKGEALQTAAAAYTSTGVYGTADAGAGATMYGGYFYVGGAANGSTLGSAIYGSNAASSVNILQLQDNTTDVFTVANGGAVTAKNQTDSTAAFQVQNAAGTNILLTDTTNQRISIGAVGGFSDTPTKLSNPASLPPDYGSGASFSPDGTYMSVAHNTSPYVTIYKRSGDTFTKLANPASLPAGAGYSTAFSPDGNYMAVSHTTTPFVTIYKITAATDTFTKIANPASLPAGNGRGLAFSPDGQYMTVGHGTTPFITTYKITVATDTFTKLSDPATLPAADVYGVSYSPDSLYMATAHATSPYVTIYKRSGDTFSKLTNPGTLPTGTGSDVSFSPNGMYLAVSHLSSPNVTIYKRSGDTFTKLTNPGTLPAGNGEGVRWSPDSNYMIVASGSSPYINVYKRSGDTFTKQTNPGTLPAGGAESVGVSPDGTYTVIGHATTPFISIYKGSGIANNRVELALGTTSSEGLSFGKELQLYRSAPNTLSLANGGNLTLDGGNLRVQGEGYFSGNVGINNTAPSYKLSVVNDNPSGAVASVFNSSTFDGGTNVGLRVSLGVASTTTNARFIQFHAGSTADNNGTGVGRIRLNNNNVAYETGAADFAEWFDVSESVAVGEIVAYNQNGTLSKAQAGSPAIVGVASNTYGFTGGYREGDEDDPSRAAIGLTGQIKVKVTGAAINVGDPIGISLLAGIGQKQAGAGYIVGYAQESFSGSGTGTIMVYLNQGYYAGPTEASFLQNGGSGTLTNLSVTGSANVAALNVSGATTLTNLVVTGDATVQGVLTVTSIEVGTITVNGHIITAGNAPVGQVLGASGTGASYVIDGNDTAGTLTITTGTTAISAGDLVKITFHTPFGKVPKIVLSAQDESTNNAKIFPTGKTVNDYTLKTSQILPPNTTYTFDYFIIE